MQSQVRRGHPVVDFGRARSVYQQILRPRAEELNDQYMPTSGPFVSFARLDPANTPPRILALSAFDHRENRKRADCTPRPGIGTEIIRDLLFSNYR